MASERGWSAPDADPLADINRVAETSRAAYRSGVFESDAEFTARVIAESRAKRERQDPVARAVLTNRVRVAITERLDGLCLRLDGDAVDAFAEAAVEVFDAWLRDPPGVQS